MARQVLPIVGAIIGGIYGGPAGAQAGYAIGSIIGNAVDPQIIKGPKLGDAGLQTSAEGVFRPIVYGTAAVKGNVVERGNRQIRKKRERQGKGGPVTETERVYWTFAIRISEPIAAVLRIWQDEKLVYDITPTSTIVEESTEFAERFRLYLGDEDQLPDPGLEAYKGIGNVNAYRGSAYAVFPDFDLTDTGERIPDFRWEVAANPEDQSSIVDTLVLLRIPPPAPTENASTLNSPDGDDFSGAFQTAPTNSIHIIAGPTRYLVWFALAYYSENGGATWVPSTGGFLGGGGGSQGASRGDVFLIPAGILGMNRSVDEGTSFTELPYPACPRANAVAMSDGQQVAVSGYEPNCFVSDNYFDTNTAGADVFGGDSMNFSPFLGHDGTRYVCGTEISDIPRLAYSTSPLTLWLEMTVPYVAATTITCGAFGNGIWVFGTDNGEIYYSDEDFSELFLADDDFGAPINEVKFNGSNFIMVGDVGATTGDGIIKVSPDGNSWAVRTTSAPFDALGVACLTQSEQVVAGQPVSLGSIVSSIGQRPGLPASLLDVAELTDMVDGIAFAGDYSCGDAISTMMPIYMFDATEFDGGSGYKIHFPKRGAAVVATLTIDDFIDIPDKTIREDALERPRVLHMHFENPAVGYVPAKASPRRFSPDVKVNGERSIQVPVVFSDVDEAWRRADVMLKVVYAEIGGEEEFTISSKWLSLVPTDNLGIVLRGQVRRLRLVEGRYESGAIKCKFLPDRQSNYTSNLTGIPLPEVTPPPPSIVGQTVHAVLDIPALNDNNDRLLWYEAASGQLPAWYGAQTQYKLTGASNFEDATAFSQNTIMGVLLDPITAASEHYTDTTNVVRVQLYTDDEIDSLTDQQFLSEGGSFALANGDGTWEVLQGRDAVDEGDGIFAISHLARGRLVTGATAHVSGQMFVLLDTVRSVDAVTAWLNTDITHRAVSYGTSPETASQFTEEYTGQSQIEFPIASFEAERVGDTISGTIVPRYRFGTEDAPVRSVNWNGFRVTASAGGQVNSIIVLTEEFSIDVTGFSSPVDVAIAQMNRLTGAGPSVSESIA